MIFRLLSFMMFMSPLCVSAADFYDESERGWHWYENLIAEQTITRTTKKDRQSSSAQMKLVRQTVQNALDKAILTPSKENIERYIMLQNKLSQQSSIFANIWQQILLDKPNLNYQNQFPTSAKGRQLYKEAQVSQYTDALEKMREQTGLFLFFSSDCIYCQHFAPIVKSFAERHQFKIIPITLNGGVLPEFPYAKVDKGQAAQFGVTVTPALYAVNPKTARAYPVSIGISSFEELTRQLYEVSKLWERVND